MRYHSARVAPGAECEPRDEAVWPSRVHAFVCDLAAKRDARPSIGAIHLVVSVRPLGSHRLAEPVEHALERLERFRVRGEER